MQIERRVVLDLPVPVSEVAELQWNGTNLLVVARTQFTYYARLLDAQLHPLGEWMEIGSDPHNALTLSADPDGFVLFIRKIVYDDTVAHELYARRIGNDGTLSPWSEIRPGEIRLSTMQAVWDGAHHVLITADGLEDGSGPGTAAVVMHRLTQSLVPVGDPVVLAEGKFDVRELFSSGDELLAVLQSFSRQLLRVRRDGASELLPLENILADTAGEGRLLTVGFSANGIITGRITDHSLQPLSPPFAAVTRSRSQLRGRAAVGGTVDMIVWQERDDDSMREVIRAARIAPDGTVLDDPAIPISTGELGARDPAVTFDGTNFVVAWAEEADALYTGKILARRVAQNGSMVDPAPIVISNEWGFNVEIASDHVVTLVIWTAIGDHASTHGPGLDIVGSRLLANGTLLDPAPIRISTDPWDHIVGDVAAGDEGFLVGWSTSQWYGGHSPSYHASVVAQIGRDGNPGQPVVLRELLPGASTPPQVAWNGKEWSASWTDPDGSRIVTLRSSGTLALEVSGSRTIAAGRVVDASSHAGKWLLATHHERFGDPGSIVGLELPADLSALRTFIVASTPDAERAPAFATDGTRSIVVYERIDPRWPWNAATRIRYRLLSDRHPSHPVKRRGASR